MSEELKPASVHDANVFLPGSLGPVRREVVLAYEHDRVVDQLRAELAALKAGQGEAVAHRLLNAAGEVITDICGREPGGIRIESAYTTPAASADAVSVPIATLSGLCDYVDHLLGRVNHISSYAGSTGDDAEHDDADYMAARALLARREVKS